MPRVKTFNVDEVLNKAMHLFWKQGYSATSMHDLVNHCGINRASLYDTFGGKEQLFKKSFELYRKTNSEGLKQFLGSHSNVKQGFEALFNTAINEAVNDVDRKGCFVVNTTTELIPNDEKVLDALVRNKREFEKIFFDYLKSGKENGQLTNISDLKSLAALFFTLYNGIKVVSKVRPNKSELLASLRVALTLLD